jgi:hypothetical protein
MCGVLAGISCGYLILSTTLRRYYSLRECSVLIWGFRGPLGAFLSAWGGIAMIASAPFDNWWHNAYGLDVKILSPPHMVLAAGIMAVHAGALILILGQMNRASGSERARLHALFLYVGGMILVSLTVVQMEITHRGTMHTAHFYGVVALVAPLVLAAVARASGYRWAASVVAGTYFLFVLLMSWILPLFPAEPKLGPVYHSVTQFIPPEFPLLLIVPALALDLLWLRTALWGGWLQALWCAVVFLATFAAVQWPFADFLMSPAARNAFFGAKYYGYYVPDSSLYARHQFYPIEPGLEFWKQAALALATAVLSMRLGLACGKWMQCIRR